MQDPDCNRTEAVRTSPPIFSVLLYMDGAFYTPRIISVKAFNPIESGGVRSLNAYHGLEFAQEHQAMLMDLSFGIYVHSMATKS